VTSYTPKGNYPYPAPTDPVTDYPTAASTFAGYVDNLPNRNRIINGTFDIWQRGATTYSNPASGTYTADRWVFTHNGTGGTMWIAPFTLNPGTLVGGMQGRRALNLNITNAGSPAATSQTIGQRIEDVRTFASETITISGWLNNSGAGLGVNSVTIKAIQNFGTGGSPSTAVTTTIATKSVTGSWVRFTATTTLPSISGKTIGSDENSYLEIQFDVGSSTGSLWLWGVQLEQNSTATALERRPIQQELALCQRYYETSYATGTSPGTDNLTVVNAGGFVQYSANAGGGFVTYSVRKRVLNHSVSVWAPLTTPSANKARRSYDGTIQAAGVYAQTEIGFNMLVTGGTNDLYQIGWSASAEL
jgi:hypothetical protein